MSAEQPEMGAIFPVFQPSPEDWPYLRRLGWAILTAATVVILWRASNLLLLAFGSVIGAVVFRSAAARLQSIGIGNRRFALVLAIVVVLAVIGLLAWLLGAQFGEQLSAILGDLPVALAVTRPAPTAGLLPLRPATPASERSYDRSIHLLRSPPGRCRWCRCHIRRRAEKLRRP
jgi:predicted PurR-regulated permease PerM